MSGQASSQTLGCQSKLFPLRFIILRMCFVCMYVCAPHTCLVPKEARRGSQSPWNWSDRRVLSHYWNLGTWLGHWKDKGFQLLSQVEQGGTVLRNEPSWILTFTLLDMHLKVLGSLFFCFVLLPLSRQLKLSALLHLIIHSLSFPAAAYSGPSGLGD